MPACYCRFANCNGKNRPPSTVRYHRSKDLEAQLEADPGITQHTPIPPSHPKDSTAVPAPPPQPFSTTSNHSTRLETDEPSHTSSLLLPDNYPSSSIPLTPPSHYATSLLEERGRRYMEEVSHISPSSDHDDVGDLDEEGEDDPDLDSDEALRDALAAGRVSEPTGNQPAPYAPPFSPDPILRDPSLADENSPDPFHIDATQSDSGTITRHNTSTPLFLLYLLVSWLHTHFHLPFLACNAVLVVVLQILHAAGFPLPPNPYRTLATVTLRLGVEPVFQILPVCGECLEVHPSTTSTNSKCIRCELPLYKSTASRDRHAPSGAENHRPHLQFPTKSIEAHLREILTIPGMEDVMESWRYKQRTPGKYCDNFDGAVCKTILGIDGRPFFENPRSQACTELRIGLSLGVDWYAHCQRQLQ